MRLAALLHDADDRKYFTPSKPDLKYENAVQIITESLESHANPTMLIIDQVCEMISYVSASGNGNSVPERCTEKPYLLWPRFSDRLEAIGTIGMILGFVGSIYAVYSAFTARAALVRVGIETSSGVAVCILSVAGSL
ncbi:MAG: hypothetical protein ACK559_28840, partial [bacterium]